MIEKLEIRSASTTSIANKLNEVIDEINKEEKIEHMKELLKRSTVYIKRCMPAAPNKLKHNHICGANACCDQLCADYAYNMELLQEINKIIEE